MRHPRLSRDSRCHGFSLIELLVVAGLILIITALALPNLVRSRFSANEASAASSLRLLNNLENQYAGTYNSFSQDLDSLGPNPPGTQPTASAADLADIIISGRVMGNPTRFEKSGYRFVYTAVGSYPAVRQFSVTADPNVRGGTGQRSFFMDQSGIIRSNNSAPANASDSPIS